MLCATNHIARTSLNLVRAKGCKRGLLVLARITTIPEVTLVKLSDF